MKKLAALFATTIASTAMLGGCDGSTAPETVYVHDTTRIHDTTYYNDRLAKASAVVHGVWSIKSPSDSATGTFFQIDDSVVATIDWSKGGSKDYSGRIQKVQSDAGNFLNLRLIDESNKIVLTGKLTDSAKHLITGISGSVVDRETFTTISTWEAKRTF